MCTHPPAAAAPVRPCLAVMLDWLTHTVKQRIRAIKNIGKITKAMKMVAASKMRNAQTAVESSRGIVDPFIRLFGDFPGEGRRAGVGTRGWGLGGGGGGAGAAAHAGGRRGLGPAGR